MLGCHIDITARKQSEAALRRQAERLQYLHSVDQAILRSFSSAEAVAKGVLQNLIPLLGCQRSSVAVLAPDGGALRVLAAEPDGFPDPWEGLAAPGPASGVCASDGPGGMQIVADTSCVAWQPGEGRGLEAAGIRAFIRVPLVSERELGTLPSGG